MPALRPPLLEAAVDVPAEVVEGRRDDGDREDVLHRRRHDVLATRDARFVRHEADVNQPHDHDGPVVEGLRHDQGVEVELLLDLLDRGRLLGEQRQDRRKHPRPPQAARAGPVKPTRPSLVLPCGRQPALGAALWRFATSVYGATVPVFALTSTTSVCTIWPLSFSFAKLTAQ